MARVCPQCAFYTDNGETTCPTCHVAMQLTFLPPPGQPAVPLPKIDMEPAPAPMRHRPRETASSQILDMFGWMFRGYRTNRYLVSTVLGAVFIAGGALFGWGTGSVERRFDRIVVGMDEQEVRNILSPPNRGRRWRTPDWYNRPVLNTNGYATFTHTEAGGTILVEFMNGRVMRKSFETPETASR